MLDLVIAGRAGRLLLFGPTMLDGDRGGHVLLGLWLQGASSGLKPDALSPSYTIPGPQ